eukprot:scaffold14755_cov57-Phaeocystis_antarctica.AAC.1
MRAAAACATAVRAAAAAPTSATATAAATATTTGAALTGTAAADTVAAVGSDNATVVRPLPLAVESVAALGRRVALHRAARGGCESTERDARKTVLNGNNTFTASPAPPIHQTKHRQQAGPVAVGGAEVWPQMHPGVVRGARAAAGL